MVDNYHQINEENLEISIIKSKLLKYWSKNPNSTEFIKYKLKCADYFQEKVDFDTCAIFCNSGDEAVEIALSQCFENRKNLDAKKIITFEGITTQDKKDKVLVSIPEMESSQIKEPVFPEGWTKLWEQSDQSHFNKKLGKFEQINALLNDEINSLLQIKQYLSSGMFYAILVEPLQIIQKKKYTSARYHNGIIALANTFQVPIIYDERKTLYFQGMNLFWYRMFDLHNSSGKVLYPDYVIGINQVRSGVLMSSKPLPSLERYSTACLIQNYVHELIKDQSQTLMLSLEQQIKTSLYKLVKINSKYLDKPKSKGFTFSLHFKNEDVFKFFITKRLDFQLLYFPIGKKTVNFRIKPQILEKKEIELIFNYLNSVLNEAVNKILSNTSKIEFA